MDFGHLSDLGLIFMAKSEKPHCGFPEKNYAKHAETLARKGHRVMVIEQVETPDQLKARNSAKPRGQPKEKVVRREKCALLSAGTIVDQEMLEATPLKMADDAFPQGSARLPGFCEALKGCPWAAPRLLAFACLSPRAAKN